MRRVGRNCALVHLSKRTIGRRNPAHIQRTYLLTVGQAGLVLDTLDGVALDTRDGVVRGSLT